MPCSTTAEIGTKLDFNSTGGRVAERTNTAIRQSILQNCQVRNILSRSQANETFCGQVKPGAIGHTTLQEFQAKFNTAQNSPYQAFHLTLNSLIIDMVKKAAKAHQNVRLNLENKQGEEAERVGSGSGFKLRGETAGACPQPRLHDDRPLRIIFLDIGGANPG